MLVTTRKCMESTHTQGQLVAFDKAGVSPSHGGWNATHSESRYSCSRAICDSKGEVVALVVRAVNTSLSGADTRPNARRLVACWNACEGLDIEFLEKLAPKRLANQFTTYCELVAQRDVLLAALKEIEKIVEQNRMPEGIAKAAIAKVEANDTTEQPDTQAALLAASKAVIAEWDNYWVGKKVYITAYQTDAEDFIFAMNELRAATGGAPK